MPNPRSDITINDLLFPATTPFNKGYLDVGSGHEIFYHELGNPDGPAVLLVHGGPGCGLPVKSRMTRLHDPKYFRIIAVDQRGCGKSIPHFANDPKRAVHENNPQRLAQDFEKIRTHLGIKKWHVFGGSWGSCLSFYYASKFPKSVLSLTIYGIWMHTPKEIAWYINYMGLFHPEQEAKLLKVLPPKTPRFNRLNALYKSIMSPKKSVALKTAEALGRFEDFCCNFNETKESKSKPSSSAKDKLMMIAIGALEIFFMKRHPLASGWFKSERTKKAIRSILHFAIVQSRYDIICPPTTAYELHMAHKHSTLRMVHYAGHTSGETNLLSALVRENERLKYLK